MSDLTLLVDCRRLFVRDMEVMVDIGVHERERHGAQRMAIDLDVYVPLGVSTPARDRLDEVLDYDFMRRGVLERIAQGHIELQETLCDDLLAYLLARPEVRAARVRTAKLDVYPDCREVGCERFSVKDGK